MTTTATFTEFLRDPRKVLAHIDEGDVVLHRRDHADLVVSTVTSRLADTEGLKCASIVMGAALTGGPFEANILQSLPWASFLSPRDRQRFSDEVLQVARACLSVGHFDKLRVLIDGWRATAEAIAQGIPADGSGLVWLDEPVAAERP